MPVDIREEGVEDTVDHGKVDVENTDWSGRDDEVEDAEDRVEGMVEHVEDSVGVVPQQLVVKHVGMDSGPVDNSDEHG